MKKKKLCNRKNYHKWEYNYENCPSCGYEERCCKNCTICEGKDNKGKWEVVSS